MILLIGMLLFKEEDMQKKKREEHSSVLYTTSSQNGKRRNQHFPPFGGRSLECPIQPKTTTPSCMNPTGNAKRE